MPLAKRAAYFLAQFPLMLEKCPECRLLRLERLSEAGELLIPPERQ